MKIKNIVLNISLLLIPFLFSACACLCARDGDQGEACSPGRAARDRNFALMGGRH